MKRLYYNVPPCPECGSRKTGRYVKKPMQMEDVIYVQSQSLENGELIRFVPREPIKNCYCEECKHEWGRTIHASFISEKELEEQIEARGTRERYFDFIERYPQKHKSIFKKIFGFFPR